TRSRARLTDLVGACEPVGIVHARAAEVAASGAAHARDEEAERRRRRSIGTSATASRRVDAARRCVLLYRAASNGRVTDAASGKQSKGCSNDRVTHVNLPVFGRITRSSSASRILR